MKKKIFLSLFIFLFSQVLLRAQFTTPGIGQKYSLETLSNISSGAVVKESPAVYSIKSNLNISVNDSLVVNDNNVLVKIDPNITVTISGYFATNSTASEFTSTNITQPYTGFLFNVNSKIALNNSKFSYGGGINCLTKKITVDNCEFYKNQSIINTTSIFRIYTNETGQGIPLINNSRFLENTSTAFEVQSQFSGVHFTNNYVYKNIKVGSSQVIIKDGVSMLNFPIQDSIKIKNNQIIGNRNILGTGGLDVRPGIVPCIVSDNIVKDNSFGILISNMVAYGFQAKKIKIDNNTVEYNNVDLNNSTFSDYNGAGIYFAGSYLTTGNSGYFSRNKIRNNMIGINIFGNYTNLGNDDINDYNVGQNIFYNNVRKNGQLCALYIDGKGYIPISKFNCWREGEQSSYDMVKSTIYVVHLLSGTVTPAKVYPFLCSDGTVLATEETADKNSSKVYPIPNNGIFYIFGNEKDAIKIFDLSGRIVFETEIDKGENKIETGLSSGSYLVQFKKMKKTIKMIVKK